MQNQRNHDSRTSSPTPRTTVKRLPARGLYDREAIYAILDEALTCHVGFVDEGQPFVIPTIHVRHDHRLILHGSRRSRLLIRLAEGAPACVTVTLLDGLVLARSAFHHSMNYRSVVLLGQATEITDRDEKRTALYQLVERIVPGRSKDSRGPSEAELQATAVVTFPLDEMSAKVRVGPPKDEEADYDLPHWAGVIPLSLTPGDPIPDPRLRAGIPAPDYAKAYACGRSHAQPATGGRHSA